MAGRGVVLASRILNEIAALELIVTKVERAWKAAGANQIGKRPAEQFRRPFLQQCNGVPTDGSNTNKAT